MQVRVIRIMWKSSSVISLITLIYNRHSPIQIISQKKNEKTNEKTNTHINIQTHTHTHTRAYKY